MSITVLNLRAGPFAATGNAQSLPYDFMCLTPSEIAVYTLVDGIEVSVSGNDYTNTPNRAVGGAALEGGAVEIKAGAVAPGAALYVRANPYRGRNYQWSDTGSRLRNLNDENDRMTLRQLMFEQNGGVDPSIIEGAVEQAIGGALDGKLNNDGSGASETLTANLPFSYDLEGEDLPPEGSLARGLFEVDQKPTGHFFSDEGGLVQRFSDRVFIGEAVTHDGRSDPVEGTWVSDPDFLDGVMQYIPRSAQCLVMSEGSTSAIATAVRSSSNFGTPDEISIGFTALNYQDNIGGLSASWGYYATSVRAAGAMGVTHCFESDIANLGATVPLTPNNASAPGSTVGFNIASGGEATVIGTPGANAGTASAAIVIKSNDPTLTADFDKGIVFHRRAIHGTDGDTGFGTAIAFANRQFMTWFNNSDQQVAGFGAVDPTPTSAMNFLFTAAGIDITHQVSAKQLFRFRSTPEAQNFLEFEASPDINAPGIYARSDVNSVVGLGLYTKGLGNLRTNAQGIVTSHTQFQIGNSNAQGIVVDSNQSALRPINPSAYNVGSPSHPFAGAYTGEVVLTSGIRIMSGAQGPNGVATAPPGSIYTCTTGSTADILWIKVTGTGNTGWAAIAAKV